MKIWVKNCRVCGAKITRTLGVAQCRVVSGVCGGAPSRVLLPLRARGGFRGKRKVCNGGPSGFRGRMPSGEAGGKKKKYIVSANPT